MRSLLLLLLMTSTALATDPIVQELQDASVTIRTESPGLWGKGSQGSGVLFTRKVDGENVTFVWTAAHVVDNLRKTRTVIVNGNPKVVVEFNDACIVQEFRENGRRIGEQKMECRIVRYSNSDQGEDLALLEVRKRDFTKSTVKFYDGDIPSIGTELFHVGSLLGQVGSNSLTTGVVSQIGRVLDGLGANGVIFDQTTVTAFPGSSGGGVFLKSNGQYVGMLVRGAGEQFNLVVPIRRLRDWAKSAQVEWAVDSSISVPDDWRKAPIEDSGVEFESEGSSVESKNFPYLLRIDD